MSDPRPPDDGPNWPERDLEENRADEPEGRSDDPYRYEPLPPFQPSSGGFDSSELAFDDSPPAQTPVEAQDLELDAAPIDQRDPWRTSMEPEPEPEPIDPERFEPEPEASEGTRFEAEPESAGTDAPPGDAPIEPEAEPMESEPEGEPEPQPMEAEPEGEPEPEPIEVEPEPEPEWIAADAEPEPPNVESSEPTTTFAGSPGSWDPKRHGNRRRPTTAEQAVPWLIGLILALTGMVIVLLALIFSSPDGLVAGLPSATPSASGSQEPSVGPTASSEPSTDPAVSASQVASASAEPTAGPTQTPRPGYGPLEMVYLGRPSAVAPIYLLRRDFSKRREAEVVAQAEQGVAAFVWSPDGRVGAAVISGRAVALNPGQAARQLVDSVNAMTFGWDSDVIYGVRITRDGGNDRAQILQIDFVSGATDVLANIRYRHPVTGPDAPLAEAQFIDDGGLTRIYAVADGNLVLWVLGAPATYRIDPADGSVTEIARQPTLWSADGTQRITLHESNGSTSIRLRDRGSNVLSAVTISGLVSHVRWAGSSNEIVFTVGRLGTAGGVRQDLYVWDLKDRNAPMPLTSNGASFGAEWRGAAPNWGP